MIEAHRRAVAFGSCLLATFACFAVPAHAANAADEAAQRAAIASVMTPGFPQAGAVDAATYRLGPGDQLTLWLWGPIAQTVPLVIGPEGDVFVPELGTLKLAGLTLSDARARLNERMKARYRGVGIELQLTRVRSFRVAVTGDVREPGSRIAIGGDRVSDVLPDSVFTPTSSTRNIRVRHRDGREELCDLTRFRRTGDTATDIALLDGDVLFVPSARSFIGVWGAVGRPGRLELGADDSLATLLRMGGGALPAAIRSRAVLVRWRDSRTSDSIGVSLDDVESGATNPALADGDNLFVFGTPGYREIHQVVVAGEVERTGDYPIVLGSTRLSNVIEAAGGFRPDADRSALRLIRLPASRTADPEFDRLVRLSRADMTVSEYESFRMRLAALSPDFRVDWNRVRAGDPGSDPLLVTGDVIRIEKQSNSIRVDGQVRRPGLIGFEPGSSWRHYVDLAGGFTDRGARTQVRVTRAANGQTSLARNVDDLSPGDLIWVPERPDVSTWQRFAGLLTIAAQVATVVIAVRR